MGKIIDNDAYGLGYDDGHTDGYSQGWAACEKEYEGRVAKLVAEIRAIEARANVAIRKVYKSG